MRIKTVVFLLLGLIVGLFIKTQFFSPEKTALKILNNGKVMSVFVCEESGSKCIVIAIETLTKNKNNFL